MLRPTFKLEYNKKDITKDFSKYVLSINYTDFEHGQSDEIEIVFKDSEKLWQSAWIPSKGDSLRLYIESVILDPVRKQVNVKFNINPFWSSMENHNKANKLEVSDSDTSSEMVAGAGFGPTIFEL